MNDTENSTQSSFWKHGPKDIKPTDCRFVHYIPQKDECEWVKNTPDCHAYGSSFVSYSTLYYCTFNETTTLSYVGIVVYMVILILLFIILGTTADEFFCPALAVVSKVLHMSDTVAGVTILAFGNGSPDLFTTVAMPLDNVSMVYAQLLGAGVFVTTVIAGLIMIVCPFRLSPAAFLKDCAFYLFSVVYIYIMFVDEQMTIYEITGLLLIYVTYILTVVLVSWIARRNARKAEIEGRMMNADQPNVLRAQRKSILLRDRAPAILELDAPLAHSKIALRRQTRRMSSTMLLPPRVVPLTRSGNRYTIIDVVLEQERTKVLREVGFNDLAQSERDGHRGERTIEGIMVRPADLIKEFLYEMVPFDPEEWEVSNCMIRTAIILKAPIIFFLKFVIPVVNYTVLNNGWSRLLNTLHCITMPLMVLFIIEFGTYTIYTWLQLWMIVLPISVGLAIIVFLTSGVNPPSYHNAFAFLGFAGSIAIIYRVANEVVSVLEAIGIVLKISDTTLGLTALAWGNSMGDLIADVAIAKAGYPRMGFAACFGGPLFNTLMGMGLKFMISLADEGEMSREVHYGDIGPVCTTFLILSLLSSFMVLPLLGFQARGSYGIYLMILYSIYLIFCILCELSIIHPYGTQHHL